MTIRSVLLQDYPELEYVIVDGGSTDGTLDVIRRYDSWITHWQSESDRGQSHAINKGFGLCSGALFMWLNGDDYLLPGALHEVASIFGETRADLIHGQTELIDEQGRHLGTRGGHFDIDSCILDGKNYVAQQSAFISREAFERAGGLDESLDLAMAQDLWIRLVAGGQQRFVPRVWSVFRRHPGAKTVRNKAGLELEKISVVRRYLDRDEARHLANRKRAAISNGLVLVAKAQSSAGDSHSARKTFARALSLDPQTARRKARGMSRRLLIGNRITDLATKITRRGRPKVR